MMSCNLRELSRHSSLILRPSSRYTMVFSERQLRRNSVMHIRRRWYILMQPGAHFTDHFLFFHCSYDLMVASVFSIILIWILPHFAHDTATILSQPNDQKCNLKLQSNMNCESKIVSRMAARGRNSEINANFDIFSYLTDLLLVVAHVLLFEIYRTVNWQLLRLIRKLTFTGTHS